jgi:hypothetical protein
MLTKSQRDSLSSLLAVTLGVSPRMVYFRDGHVKKMRHFVFIIDLEPGDLLSSTGEFWVRGISTEVPLDEVVQRLASRIPGIAAYFREQITIRQLASIGT